MDSYSFEKDRRLVRIFSQIFNIIYLWDRKDEDINIRKMIGGQEWGGGIAMI